MKLVLLSLLILSNLILASAGNADALTIPSGLSLPQTCKYTSPHEDFGTVYIERNDEISVKVTGLEGVSGAVVLHYTGTFPNGQMVFLQDDTGLPPEVKLLQDGGDSVFYGDTWGYDVHCDVTS
jgi:hypothetical protein